MIEVELKFALSSDAYTQLQSQLLAMPSVQLLESKECNDVYYDTVNFDYIRRAIFVRIRDYTRLEIKYHEADDPEHIYSTEKVFPLDTPGQALNVLDNLMEHFFPGWQPGTTVAEALENNYLQPVIPLRKKREHYQYHDLVFAWIRWKGWDIFLRSRHNARIKPRYPGQ